MKLVTSITFEGRIASYESGPGASVSTTTELPEIGNTKLDELDAGHIEVMREQARAALKDAGKRLDAQLDVLDEQAERRARKAREEARRDALKIEDTL